MFEKNQRIRVYLDDIEEWKVYTVSEIKEEDCGIPRLLLKDKEGNPLIRAISENNAIENKRFQWKPLMSEKDNVSWVIHYVFPVKEDEDYDIHTHGMDKFIDCELEMNLPLPNKVAQIALNSICYAIAIGDIDVYDRYYDNKEVMQCGFKMMKVYNENDEKFRFRVICPDPNGYYPEDEKCDENYKIQLKGI